MATNTANLDLMMKRLGSRSSPTLKAQLLLELNVAIRELEQGYPKPWFMESRLDGSVTADTDYMALPATFLEEHEEGSLRLYDTADLKWKELGKKDYDYIQYHSENCVAAFPLYYAIKGGRVYFGPKPDAAYTYRWDAFVRTDPIVDNTSETTNNWLIEFFDFTSLIALDKVARLHIRATEIVDALKQPLAMARDSYWRAVEARQQHNRDYGQGPDED